MAGKLGFRIFDLKERPKKEIIERLARLPGANIADVMGRFRVMDEGMKPVDSKMRLCGPAITIMSRPGDNLMLHKAMEVAKPGDILVMNTGHCTYGGVFGELMAHTAIEVKIGGLVVDGGVRDRTDLTEMGFPVFSRAIVAAGCDKDGPGEINVPIACGGVVVFPGDIVHGDADSIVVIPKEFAEEVLLMTEKKFAEEQARIAEIHSGVPFRPEIDAYLRKKGVYIE